MAVLSITKQLIHEQWGAPMEFHTLVRIEQDLPAQESYFVFNSYCNEAVHNSGGQPMSSTAIRLNEAVPANGQDLLESIVNAEESKFADGVVAVS